MAPTATVDETKHDEKNEPKKEKVTKKKEDEPEMVKKYILS